MARWPTALRPTPAAARTRSAPMAIVVIGGLITSTFLSLLVVPVVFTYVDDLVQWFARRWRKRFPARHGATA